MRFAPNDPEVRLWGALRGNRLGVSFRRQVVIGSSYIVDFFAPSQALIVEVVGEAYHATRRAADASRHRKLVRAGYTIVYVPASLVMRSLPDAVALVQAAL